MVSKQLCYPRLFILLPVRQDMSDPGGVGETVNILEVLFGDFKRTSSDIGDVLSDQLAGIDCGLVDLLEKEGPEGLDTRTQEGAVEGHVNSPKGNCSKSTLKCNRPGLGFGLLLAFLDDLHQVSLDILQRHALHKSWDVNVLSLQVVENVGKAVERTELRLIISETCHGRRFKR